MRAIAIITLALAGCAATEAPRNIEPAARGDAYQAQYRAPEVTRAARPAPFLLSERLNAEGCRPPRGGAGKAPGGAAGDLAGERLSRGDLVEVLIEDDDTFSDVYEVGGDGTLRLPFLRAVAATGRTPDGIERALADLLVAEEFYDAAPRVSVRVLDLASAPVAVSGAVFEPGAREIGVVPGAERDTLRQTTRGATAQGRTLAAALRAAGGIRPDADLSGVELRRDGRLRRIDLRGIFEGTSVADPVLVAGDRIHVPSRHCFQDDLMRPSPVSPPGVTLFLSNLTVPAAGNAPSAIGREVREVPWGTRYLQAVIDTNCVGGTKPVNATRSAVLISRNPVTGVSVVIERDIEDLLRRADRDDYDPYLLPGDGIACYDSAVTSVADAARVVGLVAASAVVAVD